PYGVFAALGVTPSSTPRWIRPAGRGSTRWAVLWDTRPFLEIGVTTDKLYNFYIPEACRAGVPSAFAFSAGAAAPPGQIAREDGQKGHPAQGQPAPVAGVF